MTIAGAGRGVAFCLFEDVLGGAELHTAALAGVLRDRGVPVKIVFLCGPGKLTEHLRASGIGTQALGYRRSRETLVRPGPLVRALTQGMAPDARPIVVLPSNGFLPVALRLGRFPGSIVAMEHGEALNMHVFSPAKRASERLDRRLGARFIDCEVAVSQASADNLLRFPHARRIEVIHNGIDMDRFRPAEDGAAGAAGAAAAAAAPPPPTTIGVAARLIPEKGLDSLLAACAAIGREAVSGAEAADGAPAEAADGAEPARGWRLRIAGEGPDRARLEATARALGIDRRVTFLGRVHDMPAFWQGVGVGVFPSDAWVESFGLSSVEALACGCRVVVSESAASREVLGGCPAASFYPGGDVRALARSIEGAVRASALTAAERAAAYAWVAGRYALTRVADDYQALFASL